MQATRARFSTFAAFPSKRKDRVTFTEFQYRLPGHFMIGRSVIVYQITPFRLFSTIQQSVFQVRRIQV
jgi:hypothetical protein